MPYDLMANQKAFALSNEFSAVYLGDCGAGKSFALDACALRSFQNELNLRSLIIVGPRTDVHSYDAHNRRITGMLNDFGLEFDKIHSGTNGYTWYKLQNGNAVCVAYMSQSESGREWFNYAAAEFSFIGIDQLESYPSNAYRYLAHRTRLTHGQTGKVVIPRIRGACRSHTKSTVLAELVQADASIVRPKVYWANSI